MCSQINQHVAHLRRRREAPETAVMAATAIGREGPLVRKELDTLPSVLGPGDAENTIEALTLTLWDTGVPAIARTAAAWALGEIGGLQSTRKLLNRLEAVFVQGPAKLLGRTGQENLHAETNDVRATLVAALERALDAPTLRLLNPYDRAQLMRVGQALLDELFTAAASDLDLSTALAMALARLAIRSPHALPPNTLRRLLAAAEPTASLAAVGALTELIPAVQRDAVDGYLYEGRQEVIVDQALRELEQEGGRAYTMEEAQRLMQLAVQYWRAAEDTRLAGDHFWERMDYPAA
jgi:hypothetical protein